jgi:hypothetical protein
MSFLQGAPFENFETNNVDKKKEQRKIQGNKIQGNNKTLKKPISNHAAKMIESMTHDGFDVEDSQLMDFNPPPHSEFQNQNIQATYNKKDNSEELDPINNSFKGYKTTSINEPFESANSDDHFDKADFNSLPDKGASRNSYGVNTYTGANNYVGPYNQKLPYYTQMSQTNNNKDPLLEKLNYMIHLLEEQQDEKTGHVMEELILYSFLGVFLIFIVDSFARAGKYTR